MKTRIYHIAALAGACLGITACSSDKLPAGPVTPSGEQAIELAAQITRAPGQSVSNLYLTAVTDDNSETTYIAQTPITAPAGLTQTPTNLQFTNGTPYYPLDNRGIRFYAYSGMATNGNMNLTAGTGEGNDALLSNYGLQQTAGWSAEGTGTPGSSEDPATILQFRHVMTQVNVAIEVNADEKPDPVSPPPASVSLGFDGLTRLGTYPVKGTTSTLATKVTSGGTYYLSEGVNYLIPTGEDLMNLDLNRLIIDDYTATAADLASFSIEDVNSVDGTMKLMPGYAYNLTLVVQRLEVQAIKLELVNWTVTDLTPGDINFEPKNLALDLGNIYPNTGEDAVNKVVIYSTDDKMYVGAPDGDPSVAEFVTLPENGAREVDLYTERGLLLRYTIPAGAYTQVDADNFTLNVPLSAGGMILADPVSPASENNPYLVTTPVQFYNIRKDLTQPYRQEVNLDLDALIYSNSEVFTPFGDFSGSYDGNGYAIESVIFTGSGLFNSLSANGRLMNIHFTFGAITASGSSVGAICGTNNGYIAGCINEVHIEGATSSAGGICGENYGYVIACLNTGNIPVGVNVGGICGSNRNTAAGAIVSCVNTGMLGRSNNPNANTQIGGICGVSVAGSGASLQTCFWLTGTAEKYIGGPEVAVNGTGVTNSNVADLSPAKLRDDVSDGETQSTTQQLNTAFSALAPWNSRYEFRIAPATTGVIWPAPVKL